MFKQKILTGVVGLSLVIGSASQAFGDEKNAPDYRFKHKITKTWEELPPKLQRTAKAVGAGCYMGCHRPAQEDVWNTLSPRIKGLDPQYIYEQWVDADNRRHSGIMSQMKVMVYSSPVPLMEAISLYYGEQEMPWRPDPEVLASDSAKRGKAIYDESCKFCHGEQGASTNLKYPYLKGQMPAYLFEQMVAYRDERRVNRDASKMTPFARMLSEEDYKDVIAYLSGREYKPIVTKEFISGIGMPPVEGFKLPDTGQIQSFIDQPGEDSDYPRHPLSYTISDSGKVTLDNNTKLMWERDSSRVWMDAVKAEQYCDGLELDGYDDWRLPLMKELFSIADLGNFRPAIDMDAFLNMPRMSSGIWTFPKSDHPDHVWHVGFPDAHVMGQHTASAKLVRCVRADNGAAFHNNELVDSGNGTVTDKTTRLLWQQNLDYTRRDWDSAIQYCENMNFAGRDDWRLPNMKELLSIVNYNKTSPSIDEALFSNTPADSFFWTNTTHVGNKLMWARPLTKRKKELGPDELNFKGHYDDTKWSVGFQIGGGRGADKSSQFWTRCVATL